MNEGTPEPAGALPETAGEVDVAYLTEALARAGLPPPAGAAVRTEPLLDGRTGSTVLRLSCGADSYVLKLVRAERWRHPALPADHGEAWLWRCGLTRSLPGPIYCPMIDVARQADGSRYWLLMHDVGADIRPRGRFSRADSARLFDALASLHAVHLGSDALRQVPGASASVRMLGDAVLHVSGKQRSAAPWLQDLVNDVQLLGHFLPLLLDVLGSRLADDYLALVADPAWHTALDAEPGTLVHGDLRRANIALHEGDAIGLFDWEFAARGPAGCDLQWHCFLHYWAYPPDGAPAGDDCDDLAARYVRALGERLAGPVDRASFERGWQLGWIRALAALGCVLADPLYPGGGDAETRKRVAALSRRAVERALSMRDALR